MEKIELSSVQAAAYWWVRTIRFVEKGILSLCSSEDEKLFAQIFSGYTEREWRNLYLKLTELITKDINDYVPRRDGSFIDAFSQDTRKGGHDRLNEELSEITGQTVPDICLSGSGHKDSVIYTNMFGSAVWYKSCGVDDLPTKYDSRYILSGDEEALDFYNYFISTAYILNQNNENYILPKIEILIKGLCKSYKKLVSTDKLPKEIEDRFYDAFNIAIDRGIIITRYCNSEMWFNIGKLDIVGLDGYFELAKLFAEEILRLERGQARQRTPRKKKEKSNLDDIVNP